VLQAAKRRGLKLGGDRGVQRTAKVRKLATQAIQTRADGKAADLAPIIAELQAAGVTSFTGIEAPEPSRHRHRPWQPQMDHDADDPVDGAP
jgi:hypothetical protein